jgi:hypothetical protein
MLHKTMIALLAAASMVILTPGVASARGGGMRGGGGFSSGMHSSAVGGGLNAGAMHVGSGPHFSGVHDGSFHRGSFHHRVGGIGFGFYAPYDYGDYYPYEGYPSYVDEGDSECHLVRRRAHTRHGLRLRTVRICQ